MRPVLLLLVVLLSACASRSSDVSLEPAGSELAALTWLSGSWAGEAGGILTEEHWTAPMGGSMLGMARSSQGGRQVFFEYARIEARSGNIYYLASPLGREPVPFRLAESEPQRAVFENPEHDFPQRVLYWREADGSLRARIEGVENGQARQEDWHYVPARLFRR
ncbi:MAG: hypothetical protein EYC70_06420 [Planctomycetota bacterium]|nr:MAG: hypothetical protein EYC70_06420 [Planctomycetota bacterium]